MDNLRIYEGWEEMRRIDNLRIWEGWEEMRRIADTLKKLNGFDRDGNDLKSWKLCHWEEHEELKNNFEGVGVGLKETRRIGENRKSLNM